MSEWVGGRWVGMAMGLAVLAIAAPAFAAAPALAAETPSILVDGEATATVVPDTAMLTLGVEAERPSAADATGAVATAAAALRATLAAQGIQPSDIATTSVSLNPVYPIYTDEVARQMAGKPRVPTAFRAGTMFHVTVKPVERTGALLSALVQAGATTVDGIAFSATAADGKRDELRAEALRDARHEAEVYAAAAGAHLGPVMEITPGQEGEAAPPVVMRAAMAAKVPVMPVEPGVITLHAAVSVRWALVP